MTVLVTKTRRWLIKDFKFCLSILNPWKMTFTKTIIFSISFVMIWLMEMRKTYFNLLRCVVHAIFFQLMHKIDLISKLSFKMYFRRRAKFRTLLTWRLNGLSCKRSINYDLLSLSSIVLFTNTWSRNSITYWALKPLPKFKTRHITSCNVPLYLKL